MKDESKDFTEGVRITTGHLKELRGAVVSKKGATMAIERKAAKRAVARRVAGESELKRVLPTPISSSVT